MASPYASLQLKRKIIPREDAWNASKGPIRVLWTDPNVEILKEKKFDQPLDNIHNSECKSVKFHSFTIWSPLVFDRHILVDFISFADETISL